MKNSCYPNRYPFPPWKLAGILGFPAAYFLFMFFINRLNGTSDGISVALFFAVIFSISAGGITVRTLILRNIPLIWDHLSFRYYFRRVFWRDVDSVYILNSVETSTIAGGVTGFKRELVFVKHSGKEVYLPFYSEGKLAGENDSSWERFLNEIEMRFNFSTQTLLNDQKKSSIAREESVKSFIGITPAIITWVICIIGIIFGIVLLFLPVSSDFVRTFFAGFFILVMIFVSLSKKKGWDKVLKYFGLDKNRKI